MQFEVVELHHPGLPALPAPPPSAPLGRFFCGLGQGRGRQPPLPTVVVTALMDNDPPHALSPLVGLPRPFTGLTLATGGCGLAEPPAGCLAGRLLAFWGCC